MGDLDLPIVFTDLGLTDFGFDDFGLAVCVFGDLVLADWNLDGSSEVPGAR